MHNPKLGDYEDIYIEKLKTGIGMKKKVEVKVTNLLARWLWRRAKHYQNPSQHV
jgi:hypothetical protein